MNIKEQKDFLQRLAQGLTELFGENCEVVLHDLSRGYKETLVIAENPHIASKSKGGASTLIIEKLRKGEIKAEDCYNYLSRTEKGHTLKTASVFIKDEKEKTIGLFNINYDISEAIMARNTLEKIIHLPQTDKKMPATKPKKAITKKTQEINQVNNLLDKLIEESGNYIGKPVAMMKKEDKIKAISYLDERGAFLVKKAGDKISEFYNISKYTLYNYLAVASKKQ